MTSQAKFRGVERVYGPIDNQISMQQIFFAADNHDIATSLDYANRTAHLWFWSDTDADAFETDFGRTHPFRIGHNAHAPTSPVQLEPRGYFMPFVIQRDDILHMPVAECGHGLNGIHEEPEIVVLREESHNGTDTIMIVHRGKCSKCKRVFEIVKGSEPSGKGAEDGHSSTVSHETV